MGILSFFRSATPKKEEPKQSHLDRVHLIVHPGDGLTEENVAMEGKLLDAMATRAIAMDTKEAAVVLLQMNADEWQKVRKPKFTGKERVLADAVKRIEAAHPGRVFVVPNASSVVVPILLESILDKVQQALATSHLAVDGNSDVLAYGEMATKCVPAATIGFARHFGTRTPIVDLNYTDALIHTQPALYQKAGATLSYMQSLNGGVLDYIPLSEQTQGA